MWTKDGEMIEDGKNEFRLPAEHFNRLLIITKVNKAHKGTYTCTAMSSYGSEILQEHQTSFLTVKGMCVYVPNCNDNLNRH